MFADAVRRFANDTTAKFAVLASHDPEDQLKVTVTDLVKAVASELSMALETVTEMRVKTIGRPDMGVNVSHLLTGYIELKAPGKGADPYKFKLKNDRLQWTKFQKLPNVFYTDGNQWALYRDGVLVKPMVVFAGDVSKDGSTAIALNDPSALLELFREFLHWQPIVPKTPKELAQLLAPLCQLLRSDVTTAVEDPNSALSVLAQDWRDYLFPDANNEQFADAYAQTMTYALLLARLSGSDLRSLYDASVSLQKGHRLLGDTLTILGDPQALSYIATPIDLLERTIAAVDPAIFGTTTDPWLYFYEDFLAEYDPQLRKQRGVYYTPLEVVQAQVRLVSELLITRFQAFDSFVDDQVITLDPALGTGTYLLTAIKHAIDHVVAIKGAGKAASAATTAARNMYAFEILVGPYAVGHLRLSQMLLAAGATVSADGVHVYLADTLESPYANPPGRLPLALRRLTEEQKRAQHVKLNTNVMVCIGNPPYHRESNDPAEDIKLSERKGGWIRHGIPDAPNNRPLLQDFIDPVIAAGLGRHVKNLYNDYVYFWRWALWKVCQHDDARGIVSFITASSYLAGPAFGGMRQMMRQLFDELWIIDLEGDNLGARKSENVFAIQTPVAIAIGVRANAVTKTTPAQVNYVCFTGTQAQKLNQLAQIQSFADVAWQSCPSDWLAPLKPNQASADYMAMPLLTDLFPWQENGMQFKRTWPIAETKELLERRWQALLNAPNQAQALKESESRTINKMSRSFDRSKLLPAIASLANTTPVIPPMRYAYRSFDRQWMIPDGRLCDRDRPDLFRVHSSQQLYLTSLLTGVLGEGMAAVVTNLIPDLHYFAGRGAKDVIPLWRDADATIPNITQGIVEYLSKQFATIVQADMVFAYCYAILAAPSYVEHFWHDLQTAGIRIPLTADPTLFQRTAELGKRLVWLTTYGEAWAATPALKGRLPYGMAKCLVATADYPDHFSYDPDTQTLAVGTGRFAPVAPAVWDFSISGLNVLKSWLGYRMLKRKRKKLSPLDELRPTHWVFDDELLELLWLLEAVLAMQPNLDAHLVEIINGELQPANDLPQPQPNEGNPIKRADPYQAQLGSDDA